ncbi:MAG: N-acetyltransferase family protein [Chloroflexi bacterium]|nr:N-acetyltransferase family protein [Chloroflexota bacterium]
MKAPIVRLAEAGDAEAAHAIYEPIVRETIISFELEPPTVEEMRSRIRSTLERFPWLVCVSDSELLGYAYASPHRARAAYQWAADVSVYVDGRFRRSGVGRGLYAPLLQVLRAQGFYCAYAGIALPNPASVAIHEAVGFAPVGVYREVGYKLGEWRDVGWWQCDLLPRQPDPAPPAPLAAVIDSTECRAALALGAQLVHLA